MYARMQKMNRGKLTLALCLGCICLFLLLADAEGASLKQVKSKMRGFVFSLKALAAKDPRVKKVFIFDTFMLVLVSGLPYLLEEPLLTVAMAFCGYFVGLATLLVVPIAAMDHPRLVDMDFVDKASKVSIAGVVLMTMGIIVYVLLTGIDMMQADKQQKAQEAEEQRKQVQQSLSSRLAEDVLACKKANKKLMKLLNEGEQLHEKTPAEVGEEIGVAIRSLVSFIKLANMTILSSEAPIQVLYEKHFLEKEVAIAFNTMDQNHKQVLETTAGLLEQYFLQSVEEEEEEEEEEE